MMDNAIPRLMWYISAIPLYELIECRAFILRLKVV